MGLFFDLLLSLVPLIILGLSLRSFLVLVELGGKLVQVVLVRKRISELVNILDLAMELPCGAVPHSPFGGLIENADEDILVAKDGQLHSLLDDALFPFGGRNFPFGNVVNDLHGSISLLNHLSLDCKTNFNYYLKFDRIE